MEEDRNALVATNREETPPTWEGSRNRGKKGFAGDITNMNGFRTLSPDHPSKISRIGVLWQRCRDFLSKKSQVRLYVWRYYCHMVDNVENSVTVDRQGRLVLPSNIREVLGLKEGGHVSIRLYGSQIILEPMSKNLDEKVREWISIALNIKAEAFAEESGESWKWMSREYAKRKLGLS